MKDQPKFCVAQFHLSVECAMDKEDMISKHPSTYEAMGVSLTQSLARRGFDVLVEEETGDFEE